MPIYEYEPLDPSRACKRCANRFEAIQEVKEKPLATCPSCGQKVRKVISWCHSAIIEHSEEHARVTQKISSYEKQGMWSHAAELADKHSEKVKDGRMKTRALENYKKAGYDTGSMEKSAKGNNN
jgi:putative FmdB family regulatory protein